ncbi:TPA: flagellar hook-basal body complex protein [Clostridium botulinum]|uniref:flagellar hook-basal body complex protein n=1 Tax=Clostridium botulinum TaxID=1491 RepID=UPI00035BA40B|nr:flagellar hook-basal body complex protein [Clostridium botulinum]APH22160.1 flagellar hook-basal body family protein [Clostridium botulinum]APQ71087.1 flagellar hook-basal body family protein [Clostridium botulinum]EPS55608.1 flagellar hook protein flgE [Clostridium botulinum Af84]MBN3349360.1 flagellar biosynthesis protein FlgE [Clostridium botulinum]MBN3356928.1 flagellar biosynthesis protein FlgE [Clostridium botulinum]
MLRSMYSGISGLKAQQTKLDIVGNNIANANTTAFKSQSIRFQDMLSQNMSSATGPSANLGGTNPRQVGLGVQVAGIFTKFTTGNMQTTGRNLDMAVDGPGFFIVGKGDITSQTSIITESTGDAQAGSIDGKNSTMDISFTRDGSFTLDDEGNLLTSDGFRIMGYAMADGTSTSLVYDAGTGEAKMAFVDADSKALKAADDSKKLIPLRIPDEIDVDGKKVRVQSFSIDKDGLLVASLVNGKSAALGQVAMASFKNEGGLEKMGKNLYKNSANSGEAIIRTPRGTAEENRNDKGYGDMLNGMIEMSNVDLAEEFTEMIVANRAFQACGKMITTGDEILQELVNLKR